MRQTWAAPIMLAFAVMGWLMAACPQPVEAQFLREMRRRAREIPQPQTTATLAAQNTPRPGAQPPANPQNRQVQAALATEPIPRDALTRYVGRWKGNFWVYEPSGKLVERKTVQVDCQMASDKEMTMTTLMFDLLGRKLVVVETSTYKIVGRDTIRVAIQRPTGKVETQNGHWNDDALFLTSVRSDGMEHLRERITDGKMLIDGYGVYGNYKDLSKHTVFVGRLKKER
jgi:hypothetical protein